MRIPMEDAGRVLRVNFEGVTMEQAKRVYFDSLAQLHEAVVTETPVDTGYLRAGFGASTDGVEQRQLPARDPHARTGAYLGEVAASAAQALSAIAEAVRNLQPITMGFLASYAPYVEDKRHMVKQARGRWESFVNAALRRAR